MFMCARVCMCMYVCIGCACTCTHGCMCMCACVCCVFICTYVSYNTIICLYVCMYVLEGLGSIRKRAAGIMSTFLELEIMLHLL